MMKSWKASEQEINPREAINNFAFTLPTCDCGNVKFTPHETLIAGFGTIAAISTERIRYYSGGSLADLALES